MREIPVIAVINCTGPNCDLTRVADSLLSELVERGRIRADACRLRLDVDADARLISREGAANPDLYAVGPITRGAFWEITSAPDIRVQAAHCAATLLQLTRALAH